MPTSQIKIFTTTFLTANHQRKNDKSIMVKISKMNLLKQSIIQIKACRLFLQVATLSGIANPDGRAINNHFLEGNTPLPLVQHSDSLTNQLFPSPKSWNSWRRMVRKVFNINQNNSLPIHQHWTQWIVPYSLRQMQHRWNFSIKKRDLRDTQQQNTSLLYSQK